MPTTVTAKAVARLEQLIWTLIYIGLLTLVLGLAMRTRSEAMGWPLCVVGGLAVAAGIVLIWVRSRFHERNS
jgi:membrane-associated phospholipid phosphatase